MTGVQTCALPILSNVGLEWLFRITQDPGRLIKRYWNDAVSIVPIIRKYGKKQDEDLY